MLTWHGQHGVEAKFSEKKSATLTAISGHGEREAAVLNKNLSSTSRLTAETANFFKKLTSFYQASGNYDRKLDSSLKGNLYDNIGMNAEATLIDFWPRQIDRLTRELLTVTVASEAPPSKFGSKRRTSRLYLGWSKSLAQELLEPVWDYNSPSYLGRPGVLNLKRGQRKKTNWQIMSLIIFESSWAQIRRRCCSSKPCISEIS